ncbi:hypothetical protein TNCV_4658801 [Trichonephila clavipes]|nr:hypothetical protein TNCV_4658801 [Trichonephila clavipes]
MRIKSFPQLFYMLNPIIDISSYHSDNDISASAWEKGDDGMQLHGSLNLAANMGAGVAHPNRLCFCEIDARILASD